MKKEGDKPTFSEFQVVTMRNRSEGEDIKKYVEEVARIVGAHHAHRNCSQQTCDLMIPADSEKGIGY